LAAQQRLQADRIADASVPLHQSTGRSTARLLCCPKSGGREDWHNHTGAVGRSNFLFILAQRCRKVSGALVPFPDRPEIPPASQTSSKLDDEIKAINSRQDRRKREAYTQIANIALDFLRRDTGTQDDFLDPKHLQFSFADDAVFVDGKSNFAASSLVILKNSFHLAMMIASLNDSKFALPRFMMFDNIEDKGMRPDRSHNFQSLIANLSSTAPTKHQIIFTTSMLSPDLRGSPYLVGPEYSKQNKTLNIH
jgi:hypothetical protein